MPTNHEVRQGECINSIAYEYGFAPDTIWNLGENSTLREQRQDGDVLLPGDVVVVPDRQEGSESGGTEQRHRFRRRGVPARLRVRLLHDGELRANVNYVLEVDGQTVRGSTDSNGMLDHPIPPNAREARLRLRPSDGPEEEYELALGCIDPVDDSGGARERLKNLGFGGGASDDALARAIRSFQERCGLNASGQMDAATQDRLRQEHGC